ncbi:MAG: hypothetical protein KDJ77_18780 [Rhodobiaceae bacterium]|nr:hypothetical protein [Rhodobiaceae bacterium]
MTTFTTKSILAATAMAVTVVAGSAGAEAGQMNQGFNGTDAQVITIGHKHHWKKHHKWHNGGYIVISDPYRSCHFLKKKARYTGSRYWWNQYRLCVNGYYY